MTRKQKRSIAHIEPEFRRGAKNTTAPKLLIFIIPSPNLGWIEEEEEEISIIGVSKNCW